MRRDRRVRSSCRTCRSRKADEIRTGAGGQGLGLIQLVTPMTPPERLKMLCDASRGFVYAVTITHHRRRARDCRTISRTTWTASEVSDLPVCAGFGIRAAARRDNVAGRPRALSSARRWSAVHEE